MYLCNNTSHSPNYWRLVIQVTGFPDMHFFFHKDGMIVRSSLRKLKWIAIPRLPTYLSHLDVTHFVSFGISLCSIYTCLIQFARFCTHSNMSVVWRVTYFLICLFLSLVCSLYATFVNHCHFMDPIITVRHKKDDTQNYIWGTS